MKKIIFKKKEDWRAWLEKNHSKESSVCVISYKKHTGHPSMSAQEAMDEAICFGWIDTIVKRLDDKRYSRCFMKRGSNAKWSDNTLKYGKRLIKEGKMTSAGLAAYKHGLTRPTHDQGIPKNPKMPKDLKIALNNDKKAKEYFYKLSPSNKRIYFRWMLKGKLAETRKKRIEIIIKKCHDGKDLF